MQLRIVACKARGHGFFKILLKYEILGQSSLFTKFWANSFHEGRDKLQILREILYPARKH